VPRASQFNSTPRFTFPSSIDRQSSTRPPAFAAPPSLPRQSRTRNDDIDEFDSQEGRAPVLKDDPDEYMPLAESNDALPDLGSPMSKRARLSVDSDLSDLESTEHPKTVSPALRFRIRPPRPEEGSDPPGQTRPVFILPDSPEDRRKVDVPAIFSPHRKSQRFVPGGLADSMRSQIMEAFSEQHRGSNHASHGRARLRVSACRSTSQAILIQGRSDSGSEEHVMLIGHKRRPEIGDTVLIQGAGWEVELEERTWAVFLDWKVE
jgi:hypothetical protein